MLGVAVGERDAVPLLVQPGGQVNGERRFADAAFGICNHDNHEMLLASLRRCQ